jgi:predicted PP-loop superfamily ATPase
MRHKTDVLVSDEVSPSLLDNLQEFRSIWHLWYPDLYAAIDIQAEVENEQPKAKTSAVLVAFSGGVDSSFLVWRHKTVVV